MSAEQYDNEPVERVEWMLRMINLDSELQEEAAKEAAAKAKANNGWK
ncbi:MAG: hypothetical protein KGL39_45800 [Patescibacteria group bacterium]|nr:hypothetical protein [Patescibacteria group bacterium]